MATNSIDYVVLICFNNRMLFNRKGTKARGKRFEILYAAVGVFHQLHSSFSVISVPLQQS
jgi:hypothetical protein